MGGHRVRAEVHTVPDPAPSLLHRLKPANGLLAAAASRLLPRTQSGPSPPRLRGRRSHPIHPSFTCDETATSQVNGHICREQGLKGFALLDTAGNIIHIERTIPPDVAKPLKDVPFAAIDIAPVTLNSRVYPLSSEIPSATLQ